MRTLTGETWKGRGVSLLWDAAALATLVSPDKVLSLRQCFRLKGAWPEDLPAMNGSALVVAGLEGCLDALSREDAEAWLESDLRSLLIDFQDRFENDAALIFWLPSGRKRIKMQPVSGAYNWIGPPSRTKELIELGRCLWAGAESDLARILTSSDHNLDPDGEAWIGLHHPRSS